MVPRAEDGPRSDSGVRCCVARPSVCNMLGETSSERRKVRPFRCEPTMAQSHGWHLAHHDGRLTCRAGKLHEKRRVRGAKMGDGDGVRRHRAPRAPTAHN